ncbi:alpha/beta hydrolase [Mesorhizobium sp. B2-3-11]|uniref:alpha/beta fold hydrolase n=1 Tax=Mesorhizobium sp. B2-3-11 TaxID=2589953 RepID=UPI001FEFB7D4|nr:alpha/beta hydrolase [Mesorhizobium sp. B2-3-11]
MKAANWLNHLEYDWESPVWHHLLEGLASEHTLIRYDARGNGMSDRNVDELSLQNWVSDLEAVANAARLTRFPLFGASQGCAVSIAYAVRHPKKVSHLILYGGFALGGRKRSPEERQKRDAMTTLMRLGWGSDEPTLRQLFSSQFLPEGTKEQIEAFNELQRRTISPECAAQYFEVVGDLDVRELFRRSRYQHLLCTFAIEFARSRRVDKWLLLFQAMQTRTARSQCGPRMLHFINSAAAPSTLEQ